MLTSVQARRQNSMTGGAEINFGGAREVYLCEFEIYSSVDQTTKVKTKKKKKKGLQFKNFYKFWFSSQNSCEFSRILK